MRHTLLIGLCALLFAAPAAAQPGAHVARPRWRPTWQFGGVAGPIAPITDAVDHSAVGAYVGGYAGVYKTVPILDLYVSAALIAAGTYNEVLVGIGGRPKKDFERVDVFLDMGVFFAASNAFSDPELKAFSRAGAGAHYKLRPDFFIGGSLAYVGSPGMGTPFAVTAALEVMWGR